MITKAMSVYCSTSLKNTAKMQKKKKICKMSTPFHICACIKKIMSIPCIPSPDFFPAAIDRKGLLFLNAHYSPALLGGGKEKANWVAKRLVPLPLRNQSASLIMGRLAPHTPSWGSWWKYAPPPPQAGT